MVNSIGIKRSFYYSFKSDSWFSFFSLKSSACHTGIKHEWQVNGLEDIKDRKTLAEKLGGSSVVTLEGKPLND